MVRFIRYTPLILPRAYGRMQFRLSGLILFMLVVLSLTYLSYQITSGDAGLRAWQDLQASLENRQTYLAELEEHNISLERDIEGLGGGDNLDLDLLDERVRTVLGYANRHEKIILLD